MFKSHVKPQQTKPCSVPHGDFINQYRDLYSLPLTDTISPISTHLPLKRFLSRLINKQSILLIQPLPLTHTLPSHIQSLPQVHTTSLSYTISPSSTHNLPLIYNLSLKYTLPPSHIQSLPQVHTTSLSYTISPSSTHNLPLIYNLSLKYAQPPSHIQSLPQVHTTSLSYRISPSSTHNLPLI